MAKWTPGAADHIDARTKDEVITVMQNVVDGIASRRQKYYSADMRGGNDGQ